MRIVFTSNLYLPVLGGSVMVLDRWSRALAAMGHEVSILTKTPGEGAQNAGEWRESGVTEPRVCRLFSAGEAVQVLRTADRVVIVDMSIKWMALIFAAGKRPLVTHHSHLVPPDGKMRLYRWVQCAAGLLIPSVACSSMIARLWGPHVGVAPNPYDERLFRLMNVERDIDYLFAGRFGPEKGIAVFLGAIQSLADRFRMANSRPPRIALVGKGQDESAVTGMLDDLGEHCEVVHFGPASPEALAVLYNRAKVAVIPSLWQEPFGLIGLEAMACGCRVVCSDQPGLREATGGLAGYCPTGSVPEFAAAMESAVEASNSDPKDRSAIDAHLRSYKLGESAEILLGVSNTYWNRPTRSRNSNSYHEIHH